MRPGTATIGSTEVVLPGSLGVMTRRLTFFTGESEMDLHRLALKDAPATTFSLKASLHCMRVRESSPGISNLRPTTIMIGIQRRRQYLLTYRSAARSEKSFVGRIGMDSIMCSTRITGQFLLGKPFVDLNWAQGLTSRGEPILADPNTVSERGRITKPSVTGGVNWQPSAFNPSLGLIFIAAVEGESVFTKSPPDRLTHGENGFFAGSGGSVIAETQLIRALDAATGIKRWEYRSPQGGWGGLLATAGGLVFGTSGGALFALDALTGKELWRMTLGGLTYAPPISFTVDGKQVIAVWAGRAMFLFSLSS